MTPLSLLPDPIYNNNGINNGNNNGSNNGNNNNNNNNNELFSSDLPLDNTDPRICTGNIIRCEITDLPGTFSFLDDFIRMTTTSG